MTPGLVLGQRLVPSGQSELACFAAVFDPVDLDGVVVTADALHTTRDNARLLTDRRGHYVFTVKRNQHRLHRLLTGLSWTDTATHTAIDTGHRTEHRVIQALPAPANVVFPQAAQAFRITRTRTPQRGGRSQTDRWLRLTCLAPAGPVEIGELSRGHWHIENKLHWGSDTAYREDHSRLRTGTAPEPWPPCATSPSAPCASPAPPTSPKPCTPRPEPSPDHSPCSESPHPPAQTDFDEPLPGVAGDALGGVPGSCGASLVSGLRASRW
ncbi:ISAs1 family transposase [Kibdelosporangium aridum]|nr:ISAs1 family transposase [Kibdelosporangium aridum]